MHAQLPEQIRTPSLPSLVPSTATHGFVATKQPIPAENTYEVIEHRCNRRGCPRCFSRLTRRAREALVERLLSGFDRILMIHLTIAPTAFPVPFDAYKAGAAAIGKLMKELRRRGWLRGAWRSVLDLHLDGRPHWHVLVDADFIPNHAVADLWTALVRGSEAALVEPEELGMHTYVTCELRPVDRHTSAMRAADYVLKDHGEGLPDWVLAAQAGAITWESGSRTRNQPRRPRNRLERPSPAGERRGPAVRQTNREATKRCGTYVGVFLKHVCRDPQTGEEKVRRLWVADVRLTATARIRAQFGPRGELPTVRATCFEEALAKLDGIGPRSAILRRADRR